MTLVHFKFTKPSPTGRVPATGMVRFAPSRLLVLADVDGTVVMPSEFSQAVPASGVMSVQLDPTSAGWAWTVQVFGFDGVTAFTDYLLVPDQVEANYSALVKVNPKSLEPIALPEAAWWAELEATKTLAGDVQAARTEAVAAAAAAKAVGDTNDAIVTGLLQTPTSQFAPAVDGSILAAISAGGAARNELTATIGVSIADRRVHHLDVFNKFFIDPANVWVNGQGVTPTTLTAQAAAGSTALNVASGAGIVNGVSLITNAGTATQRIYRVTGGGGTNALTVTPAIVTTLANGVTVAPLWSDSAHLSNAGWDAYAYFIAQAKDSSGNFIIKDSGKATFFGDSWFALGGTRYQAAIQARFPAAPVVNAGIGGNTSAQMIARFASDVPADSKYVVFNEPGVNDGLATPATIRANLETLVRLIRGIGAIPIFVGMPPLSTLPAISSERARELLAQVGDGTAFPGLATSQVAVAFPVTALGYSANVDSFGIGPNALAAIGNGSKNSAIGTNALALVVAGNYNTAIGSEALRNATGSNSTAIGVSALTAQTSGGQNTGVGVSALATLTTGTGDTGIGINAGNGVTTGSNSVFIGSEAGYRPKGILGNATTTGASQVFIGYQSGQASASASYNVTGIGVHATAGVSNSTAIGAFTTADGQGTLAIGTDSAGTGATSTTTNEMGFGTALHTARIAGWLRLDRGQTTVGAAGAASALPATPSKYLSVKDSTGTEYVLPVYAKA